MAQPTALILRAPGINRDEDAVAAIELAGGRAERAHVNALVQGSVQLDSYAMLIIPGGFSYGDHLGAGKLLAVDLIHRLGEQIEAFVAKGRPVIGICNGFQVLVKAGILPGVSSSFSQQDSPCDNSPAHQSVTLTDNESQRFECRWVTLSADPSSRCVFTRTITEPFDVPVAHGEGRFVSADASVIAGLQAQGQIALRYTNRDQSPPEYPSNPNGSVDAIAGICNSAGTVLGLMPHPENAIFPYQHPRWTREPLRSAGEGLAIFRNAVSYAASL